MLVSLLNGRLPLIDLLATRLPSDPIVFDTSKPALSWRRQVVPHVVEIQIETDVSIKFAIYRIARVPLVPAPNLSCGVSIAPDSSQATFGEHRGKSSIPRP